MENFSQAFNEFDSQSFMGKGGFVWWYGVVEDRNDPLYLGRLKVRCIGWHTDEKTPGQGIPTEDLPWADVVMPITSASMSGIGSSPTGVVPGTHVFGFFRDGKEAQEPVILGTSGGIPERISNPDKGFFDSRSPERRESEPYPPLFIDRTRNGNAGTIVDHPKIFSNDLDDNQKVFMFSGENSLTKQEAKIVVRRDDLSLKGVTQIQNKDGEVISSVTSYSPYPDENRIRFSKDGVLQFSLPSTNILASATSLTDEADISENPFSKIFLNTHRINGQLEEYRDSLHTGILTSNPDITFTQPQSVSEPVYPFNHVNYTESGHLFEMDDTPSRERLRILHRSTSYIEFLPNGSRVDNTIGEKYDMGDTNYKSHFLGNSLHNVGGYFDMYVDGSSSPGKNAYNVKVRNGNLNLSTDEGDVNIVAGGSGKVVLRGTDVIFTSGEHKPVSQKTFNLDNYNFSGTNMGDLNFQTKSSVFKSDGLTTVRSGTYNLTTGDYNINANKTVNMNVTMGSREEINGLLTIGHPSIPGVGKEIRTLLGKIVLESNISDVIFNVGPAGTLSKMTMGASGLSYLSALGTFDVTAGRGFSVTTGKDYDISALGSLTMANILGEISIDKTGVLKFESKKITLGSVLSELMAALQSLTVPTGTGPSGPPINASALQAVDQKLKQMLAQ